MLKQEQITAIEKAMRLEEGVLSTALQGDQEVEITIPKIIVRTEEEQSIYEKNIKDSEYKSGKVAGVEMAIKEAREKFGLQFEGKTIESFADAFKTKIVEDFKVEPNKKIEELSKDNETLKTNVVEWQNKFTTLEQTIQAKEKDQTISAEILGAIPDNVLIPKKDIEVLFRTSYKIEDGVVMQGDNVLKNPTTLNPLPIKDVVSNFILERNLIKKEEGRGDGDKGQQKIGTYEAFVSEMKAKDINEGSMDFNKEMMRRQKSGELKI